jgi:5-carboxymethyl-2-hydroxymuconate isomerase
MPHIVIEYSKTLETKVDVTLLMQNAVNVLIDSEQFTPPAIKARALAYSDVVLHESFTDFIHVTVSILEGRSTTIRSEITDSIFKLLKKHTSDKRVSLSVDLHEMNKEVYRK